MTARLEEIYEHQHQEQKVAPSGAAPVTVTSHGDAWTLGNFSNDILAAGFVTYYFDLHWVVLNDPNANAHYEIVFYYGPTDIECGRIAFTRTNIFLASLTMPIMTPILPPGSRIRAKGMDSVGGNGVGARIFYHVYD